LPKYCSLATPWRRSARNFDEFADDGDPAEAEGAAADSGEAAVDMLLPSAVLPDPGQPVMLLISSTTMTIAAKIEREMMLPRCQEIVDRRGCFPPAPVSGCR
jgi:hypothetical protein